MATTTYPKFTPADIVKYARALNAKDFETQYNFYSEDIEIKVFADVPSIKGKEAFRNHYKPFFAIGTEVVVPIKCLCDRGRVFMVADIFLRFDKDADSGIFYPPPVKAGDVVRNSWGILYELDAEGRMKYIRCYIDRGDFLGQVDFQEALRESGDKADADLKL